MLGAPPIPRNVTAVAGDGIVNLAWEPSEGATHYNVKRSTTSGGPYTVVGGPNVPVFQDTVANGIANGTTYFYVVSADSTLGESGNSSQVSATPSAGPATRNVSMPNATFSPVTVQARRGDTVRWTNTGTVLHSVTGDTGDGPNSAGQFPGHMGPGAVFNWVVPATAPIGRKFYYHCELHGASGGGSALGSGMAGAVEVIP